MVNKTARKTSKKNILWALVIALVISVMVYITVYLFLPAPDVYISCPDMLPQPDDCYERAELLQTIKMYIAWVFGGMAGVTVFLFMMFRKFRAVKWLSVITIILFLFVVIRYYI